MERYARLTDEYLDHRRARNYAAKSVVREALVLEAFQRFIEQRQVRDIDDITEADARQYIIHQQTTPIRKGFGKGRRRSSATVRGIFHTLALFFRYLRQHNRILSDPFARLDSPRMEYRLPRTVLTETEMIRLLNAPNPDTARGLRDRAMLEVAYSSGLRRGELIGLDVRDVDLVRGRLFIRQGKPRKDRVVPVGRRACEWIVRYLTEARPRLLASARESALFVGLQGRFGGVNNIVQQHVHRAGIVRWITWHALRHTCATHMLAGGADIRHIQELLGHKSLDTTAVYTRVFPKDLRALVTAAFGKRRTVAPPPAAVYNYLDSHRRGNEMDFTPELKDKLDRAVAYLKEHGCSRVVLFGSVAEGRADADSDIDLAVTGMRGTEYFTAVAVLPTLLGQKVDLIHLANVSPYFRNRVETDGVLLYAA